MIQILLLEPVWRTRVRRQSRAARNARANKLKAVKAEGRPWAPKGSKREPAEQHQGLVSRDTAPSEPAAEPERERDVLGPAS